MNKSTTLKSILIGQEKRAAKLFLVLFYLAFLFYGVIFRYAFPLITDNYNVQFENHLVTISTGVILIILLPFAIFFIRRNHPRVVKYLYFSTFMITTLISEIIYELRTGNDYQGGSILEVLFILFSPLFVNKRFFWLVFFGTILKYVLLGWFVMDFVVLYPVVLMILFSIVAYIVLNRFQGYLRAITDSYRSQFEGIVKGIVATIELKDPYTRGHSVRVANYAALMAKHLNLFSEETLKTFYYSCLLHDVGKIHIPDSILTKPMGLTDREYEIIKRHPVVGVEAVQGIEGLEGTVDVIRYHHERWDGKGYPDQLKELEIPLLARITSIADAFDAMTTHRSYRAALKPEEAYQRIIEGAGTQFDPHLVEVFKEIYPEWEVMVKENQEQQSHPLLLPEPEKSLERG